jgi:hypothetical protein
MSDFNMGGYMSSLIYIRYPSILDNKIKIRSNSVKRRIVASVKGEK